MKHQQQGHNECYLATIAMLTDRTIAEVKKACGIRRWPTKALCDWDKVSALIGLGYQSDLRPSFIYKTVSGERLKEPQDTTNKELDLTGKGLLVLRVGDSRHTHAMAYENGMVYDPYYTKAETWAEYHKRLPYNVILVTRKVTIKSKTG